MLTQGTDSLEETAFLIDAVWAHDAPFIVTGAMRNPTLPGADGPANVLAAIRATTFDDDGALLDHGLVNGGRLHPLKAKVLLRLLVADGTGRDDIAAAFAAFGGS